MPRPAPPVNDGVSPRDDYAASTLSPRGVIQKMQLKYKSNAAPDKGLEVSMTQRCRNSQQLLLSRGTKISDFCPLCKLHGVLCAVSVHRKDRHEVHGKTYKTILTTFFYADDIYSSSGALEDAFSPLSPRSPVVTPRAASGPLSPRVYHTPNDAVLYVLCDSALNGERPLSTAFAVSNKYLLSNQHFMNGRMRTSYSIAKSVRIGANGETIFTEGFRPVKVRCFSEALDYTLLELQEGPFDLVPLESLSLDDMLDQMDLDPEDIIDKKSQQDLKIRELLLSEFRTKIRHLTFL